MQERGHGEGSRKGVKGLTESVKKKLCVYVLGIIHGPFIAARSADWKRMGRSEREERRDW